MLPSMQVFDADPAKWPWFYFKFQRRVTQLHYDDAQRLPIFKTCLSPRVQRTVGRCLHDPKFYRHTLATLEEQYGCADCVCRACISKLLGLSAVKESDLEGPRTFLEEIESCVSTLTLNGFEYELIWSPYLSSSIEATEEYPVKMSSFLFFIIKLTIPSFPSSSCVSHVRCRTHRTFLTCLD